MNSFIKELRERVTVPAIMLVALFFAGTFGYKLMGWEKWTLMQCAFMTAITLTTVGYGDVLGVENDPVAATFTMALMLVGMGIVLYSISAITAFIVEGGFTLIFRERKMLKKIQKLSGHYIVCGAGGTGQHVIREMYNTGVPFVLLEKDTEKIDRLMEEFPELHYIARDATDDESLVAAGIKNARGLVACLSNDKDNLYLTVSAKNLNPNITVVARAVAMDMKAKLDRVGADYVVSPNQIGGLRMASEILRPHVVTFLDKMLRDRDRSTRFAEVAVPGKSPLAGKALRDSNIMESTGLLVIAVLAPGADNYDYNPGADYVLQPDSVLIVLGASDSIDKLADLSGA